MSRPEADLDIEVFQNWFLVGFTDKATGQHWDYQMVPGMPLDIASIEALLRHYTIVTFNGTNYDLVILSLALKGADNATLKAANDDIITNNLRWWIACKKYNCFPPDYVDHIDVSEVAPGVRLSLKQYACRMHSELVQDTPVDFNAPLPMDHVLDEIHYCRNDRSITRELREGVDERLQMRVRLSAQFGVDLRSKSDAQAAEAMVKAEWTRQMRESLERYHTLEQGFPIDHDGDFPHLGVPNFEVDWKGNPKPIIPHYNHGTTFKVRIPEYVQFVTPYMQQFLQTVRDCDFLISNKEEAELIGLDGTGIRTGVVIPEELKGRDIVIGRSTYRVGIGGLHSQESSASHRTVPGVLSLRTADVASYYPSFVLNAGMYPPQLGPLFLSIYRNVYNERLRAKAALKTLTKDHPEYMATKTVEGGFKIILNGTFGKLFSRYSIFYAPEFGIAVTIGGQLSLLMLIERLEVSGIRVVSANTDGIEMSIPAGREWVADTIMDWWQKATGLGLDSGAYLGLYSRDVNNYISLQFDGSVKRKGVFGESGLLNNRHPDLDICSDAVVALLTKGVPLMSTIESCTDIRKFLRVRGAKGGATWVRPDEGDRIADVPTIKPEGGLDFQNLQKKIIGGMHLGRAVRWYYKRDSRDYIVDTKSLNKVAGSDGAQPVMRLPKELPSDIDYHYYLTVAEQMLVDIGYGKENQ